MHTVSQGGSMQVPLETDCIDFGSSEAAENRLDIMQQNESAL